MCEEKKEFNLQNFKRAKAIEQKNKKKWLEVNPKLNDKSGIYVLLREENGFKFAYIGQAKQVLTRLSQHLVGYQHIDLSLKNHKLYSENNPTGWRVIFGNFPLSELDQKEQEYIKYYANNGYQLRNKTAGGQGKGKVAIADTKPSKGYYDGIKQSYKTIQKEIIKLFEKNLTFAINGKATINKQKAAKKFQDFLDGKPNAFKTNQKLNETNKDKETLEND